MTVLDCVYLPGAFTFGTLISPNNSGTRVKLIVLKLRGQDHATCHWLWKQERNLIVPFCVQCTVSVSTCWRIGCSDNLILRVPQSSIHVFTKYSISLVCYWLFGLTRQQFHQEGGHPGQIWDPSRPHIFHVWSQTSLGHQKLVPEQSLTGQFRPLSYDLVFHKFTTTEESKKSVSCLNTDIYHTTFTYIE